MSGWVDYRVLVIAEPLSVLPRALGALPTPAAHVALTRASFEELLSGHDMGVVAFDAPTTERNAWLRDRVGRLRSPTVIVALPMGPLGHAPSLDSLGFVTTSLDLLGSTVAEHAPQQHNGASAILHCLLSFPGVRANPLVATVVERACRPLAPPRTVGELAREVGVAESTLRYHWEAALGRDLRPKTVLEISILLNAVAAAEAESMTRVARDLGVHRRTLERRAIRLLDMTLTAAAVAPREVLVQELLDRLVLPNLPTGSAAPIRRAKLQ